MKIQKNITKNFTALIFLIFVTMLLVSTSYARTYTYDNLNRLVRVDYENAIYLQYRYDAGGNILVITRHVPNLPPPPEADRDNDGLRDDWEKEYFGDLSQNGKGDEDGDGSNNLAEYQNGTDPTDPIIFVYYPAARASTPTPQNDSVLDSLKGDINGDNEINLKDAVLTLRILSGFDTGEEEIREDYETADINGDKQIGMHEEIYILQDISGL